MTFNPRQARDRIGRWTSGGGVARGRRVLQDRTSDNRRVDLGLGRRVAKRKIQEAAQGATGRRPSIVGRSMRHVVEGFPDRRTDVTYNPLSGKFGVQRGNLRRINERWEGDPQARFAKNVRHSPSAARAKAKKATPRGKLAKPAYGGRHRST